MGIVAVGGAGGITYMLWPGPVAVDTGVVSRGSLRVTVDEDGQTRIKERYVISAPLAGRVARTTLEAGDPVKAGETLLASIQPLHMSLLDPRTLAEARARVSAAEASLERATASLQAASAVMELAQTEHRRQREAEERGAGSIVELDRAATTEIIRGEEYRAAGFERDVARFEVAQAQAALLRATPSPEGAASGTDEGDAHFEIVAPIAGRVLRVIQESAAVVQPGAALIEIGDPAGLEVVVDLLSTDAVAVRPGAAVVLEHWGGDRSLSGLVRLIEPSAFTKVSALGVEEQRVNVIIDLVDPPEERQGLGDGFRVEARIVTWAAADVVTAPTSALFRDGESWAVFMIADRRAVVRRVEIGRRNAAAAQVLSGLAPGDVVVVYPSDRVRAGVRVEARGE